jgi:D-ribulokinase
VGSRLAYIFGTSACAMASTAQPVFVAGVWGPYFGAMVPGMWLNEGGQSAAGAAIDHLVQMHPAAAEVQRLAGNMPLVAWLDAQAQGMGLMHVPGLHVVPEFLGNRSPRADPAARAVIAGLGMDSGVDSLVRLYVAGLCGVAYGLRQLLGALAADGIMIDVIMASGGAAASDLVRQVLANATGVPVAVADVAEPVLLGAAMLAAVAGGVQPSLQAAMGAMAGVAHVYHPQVAAQDVHAKGYAAFVILQEAARQVREIEAGHA